MKIIKNILCRILGIILLGLVGILVYSLKIVNIVPDKYFSLGLIGIAFLLLIIEFFLFVNFKRIGFRIIKGLMVIVSLVISVGSILGLNYLNKTLNFFENIQIMKEEVTDYYIIVNYSDIYQEPSDLYGLSMAYFINTDEEVLQSLKLELEFFEYNSVDDLINGLYQKDFVSILISDIVKNKLEDDYDDLYDKVRIIKIISIKKEIEDISKRVSIKNTPFNVLISGIDTYGDINKTSRNDVNIVASINPNTNQILLISIPRDYYVQLHGKEGYKDKLTHATYYGMNIAVSTIEDILDIDINYYIKVNFTTVVDLVNELDGITVYADQTIRIPGCTIKKGYNTLNGDCALSFSRERHQYSDGDRHRGRNQQEVINAIFKKLTSGTTIIMEYTNILNAMDGKFATNMDIDEITNFVKYEVNDLKDYKIVNTQLDGNGSMGYTYSYPKQKLWVMIPNQNTINKAKTLINKLFNNEEL